MSLTQDISREMKAEVGRRDWRRTDLAKALGLSRQGLANKLSGSTDFTVTEVEAAANAFGITASELVRRAEEGEREMRSRTQASDAVGHTTTQPTQPATSEVALAGVSAQEVLDHREECPECGVGATLEAAARHLGAIRAAYREAVAGLDAADLTAHVEACDSCWSEDEAREHLLGTGVA